MHSCWDLWVLMHWYTCKCLLNTLERAVEQLAGCLAKETQVSSRGQSTTARNAGTCSLSPYEYLIRWRNATWIAIAVNLASPKFICNGSATSAQWPLNVIYLIIYSYTYIFLSVRAVLKLSKLQVEWTSFLQYTELQAVILLQQSSRAANTD